MEEATVEFIFIYSVWGCLFCCRGSNLRFSHNGNDRKWCIMIKILFMEQVDSASAYYRIMLANNEMVRQKIAAPRSLSWLKTKYGHNQQLFHKMCDQSRKGADIFIFQMVGWLDMEIFFKMAKVRNIPTLVEIDDLVDKPTDWISNITNKRAENAWLNRVHLWKQSDGFICSTKYLADHYGGKFNKPSYVFPNQLDWDDKRWNVVRDNSREYSRKIVIGFMGSESHAVDLALLKDAVPALLKKYDNIEFHFVGCTFSEFGFDRVKFFTSTKHGTKLKVDKQGSFFDPDDYPKYMAKWDIGIIPLKDEPFNHAKSDLKFLEYSRLQIPAVVSRIDTYATVEDEKTGILTDSTESWIEGLSSLIESKAKRNKIGFNAYEYVRQNRQMKQHAQEYVDILQTAIDAKGDKRQSKIIVPMGVRA